VRDFKGDAEESEAADASEVYEGDASEGAPPTAEPSPRPWARGSSEELADCRVFKVRRDISADPRDGRAHDFYVIEAPDWVNVIPLTDDGRVVLIELYRHGTGEISLEIPGGMIDPDESAADAAARELLEETGYEAREVLLLGRTRPNPAIQDNRLHAFLARGVRRRCGPSNAGTEQTVVRLFALDRIPSLISEGKITHALVVTAFHLLGLAGLE
jgi:ADP-ribose pyrophosphatase